MGHASAELDVLADGNAEWRVIGEVCLIEGLEVERDEPVTLLVGDLAVPVDIDKVREPDLM